MAKRIFLTIFSLVVLFSFASAHPGDTDGEGGHYNLSTGKYHYHHGYPEHQHPGGICPYRGDLIAPNTVAMTYDYEDDYDIGYNDGYDDGYEESYEENYEQGYLDGYDEGYFGGYEEGYEEGRRSGEDAGYIDGYDDGYEEGYDKGYSEAKNRFIGCIVFLIFIFCIYIGTTPRKSSAQSEKEKQLEEQKRLLEFELSRECQKQDKLQKQLNEALKKLDQQLPGLPAPSQPQTPKPRPVPSQPKIEKIVTFGKWPPTVHNSEKQFRKFVRASMEPIELLERDENSAHIIGKSGCVYATSLDRCNCRDFEMNERGKAPCKHIYFLAMQLEIPVKDIFEDYMKP